ncbi:MULTISPECIES: mycothiol system anti-sigma-R factor [Actinopolyspora]|uniref:Mycothiol system anti-sigma-R factor n=1 Tax=Actinopolyspora saharensis TaxID=995062 RepID=A0A1H1E738_9ACTN|nr:mycothiol system anti-sigma-R factor [Actinopolyspora saharensis]NHD18603.1 mycothiol system anti-sigma-R factor [Actinopolyspora sp. BKK2]NHE78075.1 mycothiol system anti-sigma-R factor [Actinopolyspora sp. BKK1]SDQ84259.1 mycothiol system anti-sigma-R factor [Actinopolyspora saharensis]
MNPGDEPQTSCEDVLAEVWLFLDNECDQERRAALRRHLDECGSCLEHYGIEEHLKELLHRKCGGEHAPAELRNRLRSSIRENVLRQADVTVESGPEGTSVEVRHKPASSSE